MWVYLRFLFNTEHVARHCAAELDGQAVRLKSGRYVIRYKVVSE